MDILVFVLPPIISVDGYGVIEVQNVEGLNVNPLIEGQEGTYAADWFRNMLVEARDLMQWSVMLEDASVD